MSVAPLSAIGDVVDQVVSWQPERDDPDGTFTYIDLGAVDQEAKIVTGARELACSEAPSRARQLVHAGDVLVSTVRPSLNGVAHVPMEFDGATASTGFCVLRPRASRLDGRYLYQWVKSPGFVGDMVRKATGASYPAVSDRIVWESKLPLPPLPEQQRIAGILDKADALRAKRRAALAQLDTLTQSIFLDMFGDPATNPKGWSTCRLGSLVEINPRASSTGYGLKADERVSFVPMAAVSESERRIVRYEARAVSEVAKGYTSFKRGDVLVAKITPCFENGKACMTTDMPTEYGYGSTEFHVFRAQDELLASFVLHLLCLRPVRAGGERAMTGAAGQKRVPANYFADMLVPHPSRAVLAAFGQVLKLVGQIERHLQAERGRLDELFVSLQHRAFRSEL